MKKSISWFLAMFLVLSLSVAQAASIREIFESIAETAPETNGDGHFVETKPVRRFSEAAEMRKLSREVNDGGNCAYDVYKGIESAIDTIEKDVDDARTARRLRGLAKKGLIRQIIFSTWDSSTGDSEYCLISKFKVFAIDGTVLSLDYNFTD